MKLKRGAKEEEKPDEGPADPYAELFRLTDKYKADAQKKEEEGNVTNSLAMLTAIPEVDLGMECVSLHTAPDITDSYDVVSQAHGSRTSRRPRKRSDRFLNSARSGPSKRTMRRISPPHDVRLLKLCILHVDGCSCCPSVYRPNLKAKSDDDIMRDAKLEAMGLRPDDHEPRRTSERAQMATDEIVSAGSSHVLCDLTGFLLPGHGAFQKANAQVIEELVSLTYPEGQDSACFPPRRIRRDHIRGHVLSDKELLNHPT